MVAVVPTIGDNVAAAGPITSSGSADLVSAATNTGGIVITSVSLNLYENNASSKLELKINNVTVLEVNARASGGDSYGHGTLGGFCAIRVPSGQAVSYTLTEGTTATAWARISWRTG